MITSIKNYTKKNKQETKRPVRALGQMVKAKVYRQNNKKKHTHTHSQKEKKENKYISVYKKKERRKRTDISINKSTSDNKL